MSRGTGVGFRPVELGVALRFSVYVPRRLNIFCVIARFNPTRFTHLFEVSSREA